jgi:putative SOS response-associated peptidase YedK
VCGRFGLFVTPEVLQEYSNLINARFDGIAQKPAFREAWTRRRCLIPASGFYEWSDPKGGRKRPYFIRAAHEPQLALAGLWERWRAPGGDGVETCVIVTMDATPQLAPIHDRMPVLIPREAQAIWLDPHARVDDVLKIAADPPALEWFPVSLAVNDPRNDDETLIAPAEEATG